MWRSVELPAAPTGILAPAASRWRQDRLALFCQEPDGWVAFRDWEVSDPEGGRRARLEVLENRLGAPPAACSCGEAEDRLLLVLADEERRLWFRVRDEQWSESATLGRDPIAQYSAPVVTHLGDRGAAVFYLRQPRPDRFPRLHWRYCETVDGDWCAEEELTTFGKLTRAPAVLHDGGGLRLLYWRPGIGLDAEGLFVRCWTPAGGWKEEEGPLGGILDSSPTVAGSANGGVALFYAGTSRALWFREGRFGGAWSKDRVICEQLGSDPAAA